MPATDISDKVKKDTFCGIFLLTLRAVSGMIDEL